MATHQVVLELTNDEIMDWSEGSKSGSDNQLGEIPTRSYTGSHIPTEPTVTKDAAFGLVLS